MRVFKLVERIESAPPGMTSQSEFLSAFDEVELLQRLRATPTEAIYLHGIAARRTAVHFGTRYQYAGRSVQPADAIPDWLEPLRERCAAILGVHPVLLNTALINRYPSGAGIQWHTDSPVYDAVVAVSLGGPCRLRLRQLEAKRTVRTYTLPAPPRSIYVLTDEARWAWQHMIPKVAEERWSITFRTLTGAQSGRRSRAGTSHVVV